MVSSELDIKTAKVKDTVKNCSRCEQIDRLLSGLDKEHVTEAEVIKALDYIVKAGIYVTAETALNATGTTEKVVKARQGKK